MGIPGPGHVPAPRLDEPGLFPGRHRQDAPLRQQERVPGHRRHARGNQPRKDGGGHARTRRGAARDARGHRPPDLRRHRLALQFQRPGPALLPAPRRERRRHPGQPHPQGGAIGPEPRHRAPGPRASRRPSRRDTRRASRSPRCRPGRPCCRPWSPRFTAPTTSGRSSWRARSATPWTARPGSWTSTGMSRSRSARCASASTGCKASTAGVSVADIQQTVEIGLRGAGAGIAHIRSEAEDVPIFVRLPVSARAGLDDLNRLRVALGLRAGRAARRARLLGGIDARPEHLSQEPDAGRLRDRRRRRARGEPGLPDPRTGRRSCAAKPLPEGYKLETYTAAAAFEQRPAGDEVGRRMAHHLRGLPRPGPRLRCGAGADLHPGGRLVPELQDSRW